MHVLFDLFICICIYIYITNSRNKNVFNEASKCYNEVLGQCGYSEKLRYNNINANANRNHNRSRNIIWFNPPYDKSVETKVGETFLKLVKRHFNNNHRYHKIFNKNNIKVSYSCMKNMQSIIKQHNSHITKKEKPCVRTCNCSNKSKCPLGNKCLVNNIIYQAEVIADDNKPSSFYLGTSETPFKQRYNNHKKSFKYITYEKDTELSKFIWDLKNRNINYEIKWSIIKFTHGYNSVTKSCSLCLYEKLLICEFHNSSRLINKRSELVSKCQHQNKHILMNFKPNG